MTLDEIRHMFDEMGLNEATHSEQGQAEDELPEGGEPKATRLEMVFIRTDSVSCSLSPDEEGYADLA